MLPGVRNAEWFSPVRTTPLKPAPNVERHSAYGFHMRVSWR